MISQLLCGATKVEGTGSKSTGMQTISWAGLISSEQRWGHLVTIILLIKPVCAGHCQEEISAMSLWGKRKLGGGTKQCSIHTGLTFDFLQSFHVQPNIIWVRETQMSSVSSENSRGTDPGGELRPATWCFVSIPPSLLSHSSSSFRSFLWFLLFHQSTFSSHPPCVCSVPHRTCPLACRQCIGNLVWQLLGPVACGCFMM